MLDSQPGPSNDSGGSGLDDAAPATTDAATTTYPGAGPAQPGSDTSATPSASDPLPARLGRYTPKRLLGGGGFGKVFLARDEELDRDVAIKVPLGRGLTPEQVEAFLDEARLAAGLRHPAIVRVLDVSPPGDGGPFVVFEYIEGRSLSDLLTDERPAPRRLAELLARVAEAAHDAHKAGLVHRDLKPSNILIDAKGQPYVADFGLAIHEDLQHLRTGEVAGTRPYMAPEQIRGETHRLDGRTDVWSLGVIFYLGLRGRLPFSGRDRDALCDEILHRDPKPPRQADDSVPRELERICLKCLAKRMGDRYQTAADLAHDLQQWLAGEATTATAPATHRLAATADAPPARVVPKGLRAFDLEDADFFLSLLPGARDRDGLPESIRSWKLRIEARDTSRAHAVCLLYGPSGCGKSSLVKAGLIPRLSPQVRPIYVEASPGGTEARLSAALAREFPDLPGHGSLAETAAALREGRARPPGTKVLIVLDQFEQWLHHHPSDDPDDDLVQALRQCDGWGVQALLLVRDDFWMAITRFLRSVEVPLVEGANSAAVELFDARHARGVLAEFGRAWGQIPDEPEPIGGEAGRFLDQAVAELAGTGGFVIPVRLSLFAEMVRHRPWVPATLRDLGGIEGVGVTFLEETFAAASAAPAHRLHRQAAQAVLKALLPEPSSDLKGNLRAGKALQEAAGYAGRNRDFAELMHILDTELRMVTPVDPEGLDAGASARNPAAGETSYQLTHDYLVPSLRQWLTRKQRATRQGRAELRLEALTALWRDRPEPRRLPSLLEWLDILRHTRSGFRSPDERRLMRAAARHHLIRAAAAAALLIVVVGAAGWYRQGVRQEALLQRALKADFPHLRDLLPDLDQHQARFRHELERFEDDSSAPARDREVAAMLLFRDRPTPRRVAALHERMRTAAPDELVLIGQCLAVHPASAGSDALVRVLRDDDYEPSVRLRAACTLVMLGGDHSGDWTRAAPALARALMAEDRRVAPRWLALLGPALPALVPRLGEPCCEADGDATAAEILAEALTLRGDALGLAQWLVAARPGAARILRDALIRLDSPGAARTFLHGVLAERTPDPRDERAQDETARRQAAAAVALAAVGEPEVLWPRLRHADDPRLRSVLIQELARAAVLQRPLLDRLHVAGIDPAQRQALLLAAAEIPGAAAATPIHAAVIEAARVLFLDDPDPGVHSAAELLLRRWAGPEFLARCEERVRRRPARDDLAWQPGPNGHTFALVRGPLAFRMGSPDHETDRLPVEAPQFRRIDRSLAVSTTEVTLDQFRAFKPEHGPDTRYAPELECPMNTATWYDAAGYCNWLSKEAGIDQDHWCYPVRIAAGMAIDPGAAERGGFRLATEAEWEYLCRAGTTTSRYFGESGELLPRYAWTWLNSGDRTQPVGRLLPNELGLFDMLGNVWEWCHDGQVRDHQVPYPAYPSGTLKRPAPDIDGGCADVSDDTQAMMRGGAFDYSPSMSRSAQRYRDRVTHREATLGFRVVRTLRDSGRARLRPSQR